MSRFSGYLLFGSFLNQALQTPAATTARVSAPQPSDDPFPDQRAAGVGVGRNPLAGSKSLQVVRQLLCRQVAVARISGHRGAEDRGELPWNTEFEDLNRYRLEPDQVRQDLPRVSASVRRWCRQKVGEDGPNRINIGPLIHRFALGLLGWHVLWCSEDGPGNSEPGRGDLVSGGDRP